MAFDLEKVEAFSRANFDLLKKHLAKREREIFHLKIEMDHILRMLHSSQEELEKFLNIASKQSELLGLGEELHDKAIATVVLATKIGSNVSI